MLQSLLIESISHYTKPIELAIAMLKVVLCFS